MYSCMQLKQSTFTKYVLRYDKRPAHIANQFKALATFFDEFSQVNRK